MSAATQLAPDGSTRTVNYTYDALERLTEEKVTDASGVHTTDYTYDLVGNRLTQTDATGTTTFLYNHDDQLTTQTPPTGPSTLSSYDANGSLTGTTVNGTATATYTYDARNRLVSATVNGSTESFAYDDDSNRVSSTTAAGTTLYEYDGQSPTGYSQVLAEKNAATGATQAAYAYGMQLIAQGRPATGTSLYLYDGHGSVRALASTSGNVTDSYTYDAFGGLTASTGSTSNVYLYSGQRWDSILGEYDLRARNYDPTTGRFTSMDSRLAGPGDLGNANLYVYCGGNATNATDPTGHDDVSIPAVLAVAGIGALIGGSFGALSSYAATGHVRVSAVLYGAGFGAVALPLSIAAPGIGIGLAAWGLDNSWQLTWQVWENPRSSDGQLAASIVLLGASLFGLYAAGENVASNGWYNPEAFTAAPGKTTAGPGLTLQTPLSEIFEGIPDDALVTNSRQQSSTVSTGIKPSSGTKVSYWFRWGDVKHLTPRQYQSAVGDLAQGGMPDANTFAFKLMNESTSSMFKPGGKAAFTNFQEYEASDIVVPDAVGTYAPNN